MGAGKTEERVKKFTAGATITLGDIVKFGSDDDTVVPAAAATDLLIGVALHDAANTAEVTVQMGGIADVKAGGTVARGDLITSDAAGLGVVAAATNRFVGFATKSGVVNDIVPVLISVGMHT